MPRETTNRLDRDARRVIRLVGAIGRDLHDLTGADRAEVAATLGGILVDLVRATPAVVADDADPTAAEHRSLAMGQRVGAFVTTHAPEGQQQDLGDAVNRLLDKTEQVAEYWLEAAICIAYATGERDDDLIGRTFAALADAMERLIPEEGANWQPTRLQELLVQAVRQDGAVDGAAIRDLLAQQEEVN